MTQSRESSKAVLFRRSRAFGLQINMNLLQEQMEFLGSIQISGIYFLLLLNVDSRGSLPSTTDELCAFISSSPEEWIQFAPAILPLFQVGEDGRLYVPDFPRPVFSSTA